MSVFIALVTALCLSKLPTCESNAVTTAESPSTPETNATSHQDTAPGKDLPVYSTEHPQILAAKRRAYSKNNLADFTHPTNYLEQQDQCRVYNTNLLRMWKVIAQFIAKDNMTEPAANLLPNLFNIIVKYIKDNASPVDEHGRLNKDMNATEAASPQTAKPSGRYLMKGVSKAGGEEDNDPYSKQVEIVVSAPQNKCQEIALDSLVEAFKKLYTNYMKQAVDCEKLAIQNMNITHVPS